MAHFKYSSIIQAPREKVFQLLTQPQTMAHCLPADYKLIFSTPPSGVAKGVQYEFRLARFGVSVMWGLTVDEVIDNELIRERQTHGPYLVWTHSCAVSDHAQGAVITDFVEYDLAFGLMGKLMEDLYLKAELKRFFEARHKKISELLHSKKSASAGKNDKSRGETQG